TRSKRDWSSDVCSSDLAKDEEVLKVLQKRSIYALFFCNTFKTSSSFALIINVIFLLNGVFTSARMFRTARMISTSNFISLAATRSEERRVGKVWRYREW